MRLQLPGIQRQRRNSRPSFWTAAARSRRPITRLRVEGLESRCLLSVAINEFAVPTIGSGPVGITAGPDGNLWFTEYNSNKIGEINPTTHAITEFPIPDAELTTGSYGITTGADGNLWFTEEAGNKIGQINPTTHAITEFPLPSGATGPTGITAGPDGNLWFTIDNNEIGQINPTTHAIIVFSPSVARSASEPAGITVGPDGNLWFTEFDSNFIGQFNPTTHTYTEFPIPTSDAGPNAIAAGPDGNLWFTERDADKIGVINSTTHAFTELTVPTPNSEPTGITAGPDGNVWFTEGSGDHVGQINPATHAITEFPVLTTESEPDGIAAGPDGNLWFTESAESGRIGVVLGVPASDLSVSGTVPGSVTESTNVTDTLTVTNNGIGSASGVTLTDTLPSGVTFVSATGEVTPVDGVLTVALGNVAAGASATVTIVVTPKSAGTLTNTVKVSMNRTGPDQIVASLTQMITVTAAKPGGSPGAGAGPTIVSMKRFGYHALPTTLVLTFDQPLDATTAQDARYYRIVGPAGRTIAIKNAVYDPANLTVTLHPVDRISIHHRYELIVDGTAPHGVTNTRGLLLDGNDSGSADSDYRASLTWRNLVLDPPVSHTFHRSRSNML